MYAVHCTLYSTVLVQYMFPGPHHHHIFILYEARKRQIYRIVFYCFTDRLSAQWSSNNPQTFYFCGLVWFSVLSPPGTIRWAQNFSYKFHSSMIQTSSPNIQVNFVTVVSMNKQHFITTIRQGNTRFLWVFERQVTEDQVKVERLLTEDQVKVERLGTEDPVKVERLVTEDQVKVERLMIKDQVKGERLVTEDLPAFPP